MKKLSIIFFIIAAISFSCKNTQNKQLAENTRLREGTWRGVLTRKDGVKIPFNFVVKDSGTILHIKNSEQSIKIDSIRYEEDSVFIHTPFFLSNFYLKLQDDGSVEGKWVQHFPGENPTYSFHAQPSTDYRILKNPKPEKFSMEGQWRVYFINPATKDSLLAIGKFTQTGNQVTGTMLAHFHHDRYLEGIVSGNSVILSAFDAAHRVLLTGEMGPDKKITGTYYSGITGKKKWVAIKDSTVQLRNPTKITTYESGKRQLEFSLPNLKGEMISINDERFDNKVVIVQLLGSWCINCLEETRFLSQWYRENKDRGVRIIGLCFERSGEYEEAVKSAMTFKEGLNVPYPLLISGVPLKDPYLMKKVLPQLKNFESFPTTIFIDREGNIAKIHAGGMAPSDKEHYNNFIKHFNHTVDSLLKVNPQS